MGNILVTGSAGLIVFAAANKPDTALQDRSALRKSNCRTTFMSGTSRRVLANPVFHGMDQKDIGEFIPGPPTAGDGYNQTTAAEQALQVLENAPAENLNGLLLGQ
ncbi:hypothetical protein [Arthrobacter sp. B2a2-09]|uniref:hypothetical protein n=1 Tax=Arthrobacter sp. B2a2-09 TaxID=2952822 RepID=UPI002FCFCBD8